MYYYLVNARLSVNCCETWLFLIPRSDFYTNKDSKGFKLFIYNMVRFRIEGNILNKLTANDFLRPVKVYFKKDDFGIKVISSLKFGDKTIKSLS